MHSVKSCLVAGKDGKLYSTVGRTPWKVIVEIPRWYYYVYIMLWLERDNWVTDYGEEARCIGLI
jgi:hypothetical protein